MEKIKSGCHRIWIINHNAIPPEWGGLSRHYYFSKYLQKLGHKVRIFSASAIHNTDINMIEDKAQYREADCDSVTYTFIKTSSYRGNGLLRIKNILEFPQHVKKVSCALSKGGEWPDIIYASSPDLIGAYGALKLARRMKTSCMVEIRDLWPESIVAYQHINRKNPLIRLLYWMEKWIYKNADALIFTMPGAEKYIRKRGWENEIDFNKICHINNGVDIEEFLHNAALYPTQDPDLMDQESYKAVYMGSIRKANKVGILVDVAKRLQEKNSRAKLLIWGKGTEEEEIQKRINTLGLNNIVLKGGVEGRRVPGILKKADITLLHGGRTAIMEYGHSANKLFDYLAAGKPILTDLHNPYDIIRDRRCGVMVEDQRPETIADAIIELENCSKEQYEAYCENAKNTAIEYDFQVLTQRLLQVVEGAINSTALKKLKGKKKENQ